jgi:hypothetical protein
MSQQKQSTTEQINNLIEFRQAIYENGLTDYRDAQFELIDALLANQRVNSFAELSLSPLCKRGWASAYMAIEAGNQAGDWLQECLMEQLPASGVIVLAIDTTVWPHPSAQTLAGLVYEHSPTPAKGRHTAVKGHVYSLLTWTPARGESWSLPVASTRLAPVETAVEIGVQQVKSACRKQDSNALLAIVGDGKYGNHCFFGPLRDEGCAVVARLRRDRVLYGPPPPYGGCGRPRKHLLLKSRKPGLSRTWRCTSVMSAGVKFVYVLGNTCMLSKMQRLCSPSCGLRYIASGINSRTQSGWASLAPPVLPSRMFGCGLITAGPLSPAFVFAKAAFIGPCRPFKPRNAVTAGPC